MIISNFLEMNPSKGGRMQGDDEVLTVVHPETVRRLVEGENSEPSNRHRVAIPEGTEWRFRRDLLSALVS